MKTVITKLNNRTILKVFFVFLLITPFIVISLIDFFVIPDFVEENESVPVLIPRGATINAIADTLSKKGIIEDKELFLFWITTLDKDRNLKAGFYEIPLGMNYAQLVSYLSKARAKEIKVTLVEGWGINEMAEKFNSTLHIDKEIFISLCHDKSFINELGIFTKSLEGYLLPDTYYFYWGVNEKEIIKYLVQKCFNLFTTPIKARLDSVKMTEHQMLTLASIIEGEVIFDEERPIVSSVYHNRLKRRIKLRADPTIQYILGGPPRRLLNRDLEIDSPYNTYKYRGLPPGPINNPGKKSIMAAIFPVDTDFLYFVARGDGKHTFTRTGKEHAREKEKFDKIRREVRRQQRNNK